MADIQFDYFTAAETKQFAFYRIPKALFTESRFQELSCEAKVLYGMMLDRMGLSIRNQWFDVQGRAYIIFTVEDVMGVMGCGSQKAVRLMKELDTVDGIGLIEKKRIGLGRPNRIYVKNFLSGEGFGADPDMEIGTVGLRDESEAPEGYIRPAQGQDILSHVGSLCGADGTNRYGTAQNPIGENQNSRQGVYFSVEEPEQGQVEPEAQSEALHPLNKGEGHFVDKTIEAMMAEVRQARNICGGVVQGYKGELGQPSSQLLDFEKRLPAILDSDGQRRPESKCNETEYSETEYSGLKNNETDFYGQRMECLSNPIHPYVQFSGGAGRFLEENSPGWTVEGMDACRAYIRENIEYQCFSPQDTDDVDELVELMVDTMMAPDSETIRVAGAEKPASIVKSRFMKLMHSHIEYVVQCMKKHTGKIRNIKAYLLTALYNSSLTMENYYRAQASHDLYGMSDTERRCAC